jgi:outer membrane protein TolC
MAKIGITDVATGETEIRDMNALELAEYKALVDKIKTQKAKTQADKTAAETALLSSLGITKEQAIILGLIQPEYVKPVINEA